MYMYLHIIFNNIFTCVDTERNSMIRVNFVHTDIILDNLLIYCIGYNLCSNYLLVYYNHCVNIVI